LDRLALPVARVSEHLLGVVVAALLDRVPDRVEHQRDARERLDGAVVEEEREAPPLVLLGSDELLEQADLLPLLAPALALPAFEAGLRAHLMIDSRRAIATACVLVSASSFVR